MIRKKIILLLSIILPLTSCATIVEGTKQSIAVTLVPEEATCVATRQGAQIASVSRTNRTMVVEKSRHDIIMRCSAPGHQPAEIKVVSEAAAWGIVGGGISAGVDYASGALNKYPDNVTVALVRQ